MTRLRAVLAAAAALVVSGGLALSVALRQAGQSLEPPMSCPEWAQRTSAAVASEPPLRWFVAVPDGYTPPEAVGSYVLGELRVGGVVAVEPQGCPHPIEYSWRRSGAVVGWRLYRLEGPRYFARAWRELAAQDASVRFYGGVKDVAAACVAHFTAAQCRSLLDAANPCWRRTGGITCWRGRLYGPGAGGSATCAPQAGDVPGECEVLAGQTPEQLEQADFPTNAELER